MGTDPSNDHYKVDRDFSHVFALAQRTNQNEESRLTRETSDSFVCRYSVRKDQIYNDALKDENAETEILERKLRDSV